MSVVHYGTTLAQSEHCSLQNEEHVSKPIRMKFYESPPDEGLLALASHRLEELPEPFCSSAQCNVTVRRHKPEGARAIHHVQVDLEIGPTRERIYASSSDADPYAALSRAFESALASVTANTVVASVSAAAAATSAS